MAIRKKVDKCEEIISKGGQVIEDIAINQKKTSINLYISTDLLHEVDEIIRQRKKYGIKRNSWIIEAIQEKIQKTIPSNG